MWIWTQRCRLTGESLDVPLSDEEKRAIEARPGFTGWERDDGLLQPDVDLVGSEVA